MGKVESSHHNTTLITADRKVGLFLIHFSKNMVVLSKSISWYLVLTTSALFPACCFQLCLCYWYNSVSTTPPGWRPQVFLLCILLRVAAFQGKDGFYFKRLNSQNLWPGSHWKQKLVKIIWLLLVKRQWSCTLLFFDKVVEHSVRTALFWNLAPWPLCKVLSLMTVTVDVNLLLRSPVFSLVLVCYILAGGNSFNLHKSVGKGDIKVILIF